MRIKIIQIGKNKDEFVEEWTKNFLLRIKPFAEVSIVTLKEIPSSKTFMKNKCVLEEGDEILNSIKADEFFVALDENGKEFDSVDFSELLKKHRDAGETITFVIGGPYGLSENVKIKANLKLSMSKMTFTHQMIRLFLLEQIYRGICIIQGKEYHNA